MTPFQVQFSLHLVFPYLHGGTGIWSGTLSVKIQQLWACEEGIRVILGSKWRTRSGTGIIWTSFSMPSIFLYTLVNRCTPIKVVRLTTTSQSGRDQWVQGTNEIRGCPILIRTTAIWRKFTLKAFPEFLILIHLFLGGESRDLLWSQPSIVRMYLLIQVWPCSLTS